MFSSKGCKNTRVVRLHVCFYDGGDVVNVRRKWRRRFVQKIVIICNGFRYYVAIFERLNWLGSLLILWKDSRAFPLSVGILSWRWVVRTRGLDISWWNINGIRIFSSFTCVRWIIALICAILSTLRRTCLLVLQVTLWNMRRKLNGWRIRIIMNSSADFFFELMLFCIIRSCLWRKRNSWSFTDLSYKGTKRVVIRRRFLLCWWLNLLLWRWRSDTFTDTNILFVFVIVVIRP